MSLTPKSNNQTMIWRTLLLFFGVFCMSTAIIMIKASTEQPILVASYRLLVAALVLSPFFFRDLRKHRTSYGWKQIGGSLVIAVVLAVDFITWVIGGRMTQVASASLISNLTPVAMPFFVWAFDKERITGKEIIGTILTLAGLLVLSGSNLSLSKTNFIGDVICFVSMLTFVLYLILGRKSSRQMSLWLYIVPLYFFAGTICLISALPFVNPIKLYTVPNILYMVGLGLVPTVLGHTILNYSMKHIRGQVVSVSNLSQPIFSSLLGFLIFGERPQSVLYISAGLILLGILIVLSASFTKRSKIDDPILVSPAVISPK